MPARPLRRPNATRTVRRGRWTAGAVLLGTLLLVVFVPGPVVAQTCPIDQVTNTSGDPDFPNLTGGPSISLHGHFITFQSQAEPVPGSNPSGNFEIWLYDVPGDSLLQITDTSANQNVRPAISGDGLWVVFSGVPELFPGGVSQLALYDVAGASLLQITDTPAGSSNDFADINGDGTLISFASRADIVVGGNPDGNSELFLYNRTTDTFTQVTTTVGGGTDTSSLDGAGNQIAFDSTANIGGGNPDGSSEMFLYDVLTATTTQITSNVGGGSFNADLSDDGAWLGLQSNRDLVPGGNLDASLEVYLYHIPSATLTQVTNLIGPDESYSPSIDHDGTKVAFASLNDPVGGNPDRNSELFLYDVATGEIVQITDTTSYLAIPALMTLSLSGYGGQIAFDSFSDITGGNTDLQGEVFLANCWTETPGPMAVPVASGWGLLIFAVLTVLAALGVLRKASS